MKRPKKAFGERFILWTTQSIKSYDRFANPISLNYLGDTKFKTGFGGIISIFLLWALMGYTALLIKQMINYEGSVINSITKINNLMTDSTKYNLNDYNFYFGTFQMGQYGSKLYDSNYFDLVATQYTISKSAAGSYKSTTSSTNLNFDYCKNKFEKYLGTDLNNAIRMDQGYWTNITDMYIGGNLLSSEYNYVEITLTRWNGKSTWKTSTEIDTALGSIALGFLLTDYYFDSSDYSSPIKININDWFKFWGQKGVTKNVDLRIRRNEVVDQKSLLPFVTADSYSFLSIGDIFQDSSTLSNETNVVLRIKFVLDLKYQSVQRTVYTVGDMFGQIGGMNSILLSIGSIIVGTIATKIYMASLLQYPAWPLKICPLSGLLCWVFETI